MAHPTGGTAATSTTSRDANGPIIAGGRGSGATRTRGYGDKNASTIWIRRGLLVTTLAWHASVVP